METATTTTNVPPAPPPQPPAPSPMGREKYLQIMRKIDQHVKTKMLKVNTIFQQFDSSGDGYLSKKEFRNGVTLLLSKASFSITNEEINGVFDTIDDDNSNEMSYKEFIKELKNSDPVRQESLKKKSLKMEQLQTNTIQKKNELLRAMKKKRI